MTAALPNITHSDLVRGVLLEVLPESEDGRPRIVLAIPNSDYRLHLVVHGEVCGEIGRSLHGHIDVNANRIDVCEAGGQFIDPVMGRPRTIQGRVRAADAEHDVLIVQSKVPWRVHVKAPQKASDFEFGSLVRFFVDRGAEFTPSDS